MVQRFLTKVEKDKNSDKHFLDSKLFEWISNYSQYSFSFKYFFL